MRKCDQDQDQIYETIAYAILVSFGLYVMALIIPTVTPFVVARMPADVQPLFLWATGTGFCLSLFGLFYTQKPSSEGDKKEDINPNFKPSVSQAQNSVLSKKRKRYDPNKNPLED